MATYRLQPSRPLAADDAALARVLRQAGVTKDNLIRVTGPAGLTALLWLYRHGFARSAYVQADRVSEMNPAEALLVPHPCTARELAAMLETGECLREDGVLIVQTAAECVDQAMSSVPSVLRILGFEVEHRAVDKGLAVYIARRRSRPDFKKAA